ncbi:hypothetical protein H0H81_010903 [Sphagnurus paluster]|uniref:Hydrophobic surface binding protein n=1 Tax=Sphagnurus paluster TaxID=117069 RepID=A0A9P7FRB1_9AGAR|nr:hypothetical protein H0H81_010903 [Sphagnurus paluster]
MRFSSVIVLASFIVSSFASTAADIKADIVTITARINTLDTSITAFAVPGGTLTQALAIHNNAVTLGTALDKGTTDATNVTPNPVSPTDGRAILTALEATETTISRALTNIVARKAAFNALPIGGIPALVKQDLANLSASTTKFEAALIAAASADLVAEATAFKGRVDGYFAVAIAAYA